VETRVIGDVNHARAAEQRTVGVNHRRAVVGARAIAFVEVQDDDNAQFARFRGKGIGQRAGHGFGEAERIGVRRPLWMERFEGELGEGDERGPLPRRAFHGGETTANVVVFVGCRVLLDEREAHHAMIVRRQT
jgi:hypothetical protein